jgi:hypothetical protein
MLVDEGLKMIVPPGLDGAWMAVWFKLASAVLAEMIAP